MKSTKVCALDCDFVVFQNRMQKMAKDLILIFVIAIYASAFEKSEQ